MTKKADFKEIPETKKRVKGDFVDLRLYVADETPRCLTAYENIRKICDEYAGGKYRITVVDLLKHPEIARRDEITAIPTLIRMPRTEGRRKIIGALTDTKKVLEGIDLPKKTIYRDQGKIRQINPAH